MKKLKCLKCGHQWLSRKEGRPLTCPNCKIPSWDRIGYLPCKVCGKNYLILVTHHKDGDKTNNKKENLITICSFCHTHIHRPRNRQSKRKKINRYWDKPLVEKKILELHNYWLKRRKEK